MLASRLFPFTSVILYDRLCIIPIRDVYVVSSCEWLRLLVGRYLVCENSRRSMTPTRHGMHSSTPLTTRYYRRPPDPTRSDM